MLAAETFLYKSIYLTWVRWWYKVFYRLAAIHTSCSYKSTACTLQNIEKITWELGQLSRTVCLCTGVRQAKSVHISLVCWAPYRVLLRPPDLMEMYICSSENFGSRICDNSWQECLTFWLNYFRWNGCLIFVSNAIKQIYLWKFKPIFQVIWQAAF